MKRMVDNKKARYNANSDEIEINGKLQVNSSISSAYNSESSITINETPEEGITLSLVDNVNFVKEKDDLIEVHAYIEMTKTTGTISSFVGLTMNSSLVPSHDHVYLIPFGTSHGTVSGYMYAHVYKSGEIRIGDWNGISNGTRYIYLDLLYYKH